MQVFVGVNRWGSQESSLSILERLNQKCQKWADFIINKDHVQIVALLLGAYGMAVGERWSFLVTLVLGWSMG